MNFAIEAIGDSSRFWLDATIDQKQRFQQVLFPEGLAFDGKEFGPAKTYLQQVSAGQSSLASQSLPSWNQIIAWLRQIESLRVSAA